MNSNKTRNQYPVPLTLSIEEIHKYQGLDNFPLDGLKFVADSIAEDIKQSNQWDVSVKRACAKFGVPA